MIEENTVPEDTNVTPPEEMNRRRRVLQLIDDSGDLLEDLVDRINEMFELDDLLTIIHIVRDKKLLDRLDARLGAHVKEQITKLTSGQMGEHAAEVYNGGAADGVAAITNVLGHYIGKFGPLDRHPLSSVIQRLYDEAPKLTDASGNPDPTQAPAIPMVFVSLKSGQQLQGVMSGDCDGVLKIMSPAQVMKKDVMVEHFFVIDDVESITVPREIAVSHGSQIVGARS